MDRTQSWAWEQPEQQEEILCLRQAINHPGFHEFAPVLHCQIYTNLGNRLKSIGRFVEALEYWGRAFDIDPKFGIALGNLGNGLLAYSSILHDPEHQAIFLKFAHSNFSSALSPEAFYESPYYTDFKPKVQHRQKWIESILDIEGITKDMNLTDYEMGVSEEERLYRHWCLKNKLFINPLNDLGAYPIANQDVLLLPDYVTEINKTPTLMGFFNQMKQEFVSARWLLYEGLHPKDVHYSDHGVDLYDTLDYPSYSLAVEKVKAAFRIVYSIFDKIGFFLSEYMELGVKPNKVSFKTIWYHHFDHSNRMKNVLWDRFSTSENWAFRGLFWLSKDLFEDNFINMTEPDAQVLSEIRNHMEHKYLKVHELLLTSRGKNNLIDVGSGDSLAYSIKREDLEIKTLRLLNLSRASLIYLSMGMHQEEKQRERRNPSIDTMKIDYDMVDDDLKK